jgi:xylulokinase
MGAAMSAGVGIGLFSSFEEAVSRMVHTSRSVEPDPRGGEMYREKYARYQGSIEALRAAW